MAHLVCRGEHTEPASTMAAVAVSIFSIMQWYVSF